MGRDEGFERDVARELARFQCVLRATEEAVWDWDVATGETWWSDRQYAMLAYDHQVVPSYEAWAARIHPDDRTRVLGSLAAFLETAGQRWEDEYRYLLPDGHVVVTAECGYVERGADGRPIRMTGVGRDITAQRQLEQQLAQAQKLESIGRLAGGVAHDFNNLLTVIMAGADSLARALPAGGAAREALDDMLIAARQSAELTRRLLTFARCEPVEPSRVDLNDVCNELARLLGRVVGAGCELVTELAPDVAPVLADRGQLDRVLLNLVLNARDAMPGGGRITIATSNQTVRRQIIEPPAAVAPGEYAVLAVSDHGTGIAPEVKSRMFEPFVTTKPTDQGTGFGLATVYGIVRQAGGQILVESHPGRGTTFRVMFPSAVDGVLVRPLPPA